MRLARTLGLVLLLAASPAMAQTCARTEFEAVVEQAAGALAGLNQKNKPAMQAKLRQLREKRGWSQDQFMREAAPFVKDPEIEGFDKRSEELLGRIATLGQGGSETGEPDCRLLAELQAAMAGLVEAQQQKWAYMFRKLDGALAE